MDRKTLASHFERLLLIQDIFSIPSMVAFAGHTFDRARERGGNSYEASKANLEAETTLTKLYKSVPDLMAMLPQEGKDFEGFWFEVSGGMKAVCSKVNGRLVPVTILAPGMKTTRNARNLPEELHRLEKELSRRLSGNRR